MKINCGVIGSVGEKHLRTLLSLKILMFHLYVILQKT